MRSAGASDNPNVVSRPGGFCASEYNPGPPRATRVCHKFTGVYAMRKLAIFALTSMLTPFPASATDLPWGTKTDEISWEIFVQAVSPAGVPGGNPKVEFETWASDQDIFQASPAQWPSAGATKELELRPSVLARSEIHVHGRIPLALPPTAGLACPPPGLNNSAKGDPFPATGCIGEEVRRNWASFQYIVNNGLDSNAGRAAFAKADKTVDFPSDAIEFKGDWIPVGDVEKWVNLTPAEVKKLYYVSTATANGKTEEFALVAFHFSSKLTKNWIWADFEHVKNPGRCDTIGCRDDWGSTIPETKPNAVDWKEYSQGCPRTKALEALEDSTGIAEVWKNYCMKGTQIEFVTADGRLLGNSVIEPLNADVPISNSSCITCHTGALFEKATGKPFLGILEASPVGPPPAYDKSKYASYDFVYGLLTGSK